jgi:hypothetical protein
VKQLGASALANWSAAGPVLVVYVAGRTSAGVASCKTGQLVAVMSRGSLHRERRCTA